MSKPLPIEPKLSPSDACDIQHRDIAVFVLLNVVTIGLYFFYYLYQWSKELNGLYGHVKYQPLIVLLVNVLTCGMAGVVFECLFAFDIAQLAGARRVPRRMEQLGLYVVLLNCFAFAISLTVVGVVVGFPLGLLASVLVQVELNKLAESYLPGGAAEAGGVGDARYS